MPALRSRRKTESRANIRSVNNCAVKKCDLGKKTNGKNEIELTKGNIQQLLQKSFRSHPPPTGSDLVQGTTEAATGQAIRDLFSGRRWYELDPDFVIEHADHLWSMAPAAQRYYLPAYLLATFHAPKDWVYTNNLLLSLFLPLRNEDDPERDRFVRFLDALTPAEKSAIRRFLEFTAAEHPSQGERGAAKLALSVLWRKFEAMPFDQDRKSA